MSHIRGIKRQFHRPLAKIPRWEWERFIRIYGDVLSIARAIGCTDSAVRYNLKKHRLKTSPKRLNFLSAILGRMPKEKIESVAIERDIDFVSLDVLQEIERRAQEPTAAYEGGGR